MRLAGALQKKMMTTIASALPPQTLRLAPDAIAARYPLGVSGAATWQRGANGYSTEFDMPPLTHGTIIVPSFSLIDPGDYGFRFELRAGPDLWPLAPVRAQAAITGAAPANSVVSTHLDCWHTHADIANARLRLDVHCSTPPEQYLLTVSMRPRAIAGRSGTVTTPPMQVPGLSQMTATAAIRRRICSPACVTMLLGFYGIKETMADVAARCHDADSGIYGVWPLAVHTASRHGVLGALETFTDLDQAAPLLERGWPIVASIDFASGELDGSPLAQTRGHLLVVSALAEDRVFVNDPAAEDDASVARAYDRRQFAAAWLNHRGVGYVLLPP
jgi:hypothetical protein